MSEPVGIMTVEQKRKYVKSVTDVATLKEFFEDPKENWGIRLQALVNIKDDDYLEQVAVDKRIDWTFRREAMERIESQRKLFELAKNETHDELKQFLITRLKVRPMLKALKQVYIKNKTDPLIINSINDQMEVAVNSISFIFED